MLQHVKGTRKGVGASTASAQAKRAGQAQHASRFGSDAAQRLPAGAAGGRAERVDQHSFWPVRRPVHWPELHCRHTLCPALSVKLCSGRRAALDLVCLGSQLMYCMHAKDKSKGHEARASCLLAHRVGPVQTPFRHTTLLTLMGHLAHAVATAEPRLRLKVPAGQGIGFMVLVLGQ